MHGSSFRWMVLVTFNFIAWGVLSFCGPIGAAPKVTQQPFANPVEQSNEVIRELKEIKALLQEQNGLLRTNIVRKAESQSTVPKK